MGKHLARAAVRRKAQHRRRAVRLAVGAGTAIVAVSAFAVAASGDVLSVSASWTSEASSGASSASSAAAAAVPVTGPSEPVAPVVVSAAAGAALSYSRTQVRTVPKPEPKKLVVASAQVERPAKGTLMAPLKVLNPSSPFGVRTSPITGTPGEFHWGKDFAAACGTAVYSADAGVVRSAGWDQGGGGNRVELDHGNGLVTTYNHLEGVEVRKGQRVQPGEAIAKVGSTGASTGCHLHFETIDKGRYIDPGKWTLLPLSR